MCARLGIVAFQTQFAKLHLAVAVLIRDENHPHILIALYLLEPEDGRSFDVGYCWCGSIKCKFCHHNIKVNAKLKMPLRNSQVMLSQVSDDADVIFHTVNDSKRKNLIKLRVKDGSHVLGCEFV